MTIDPVFVADLGGTSLRAALDLGDRLVHHTRIATADLDGDASAWLARWVARLPTSPVAGCIAVAGRVRGDTARLTNAAVSVDAARLGVPTRLVNDLHAAAMGVDRVPAQGRVILSQARPEVGGVMGIIGVGTGLGQALRVGDHVLPGEGGHAAFAPVSDAQRALLSFLSDRHGYVDWERVVSGSAMSDLLDFAQQRCGNSADLRAARQAALASGEGQGAVVLGLADRESACALALDLLLSALGTKAGDMALCHLCGGGIWLLGGVAARLRPWLAQPQGAFQRAFESKGRFSELAASVPRVLVLDDRVGLWGAGRIARELLG
ncbi:MAG: hypothetical protein GXP62_14440 [Oligoflexia bacterium]|nr:hypothetical protein [Oligoflexia bacterium]